MPRCVVRTHSFIGRAAGRSTTGTNSTSQRQHHHHHPKLPSIRSSSSSSCRVLLVPRLRQHVLLMKLLMIIPVMMIFHERSITGTKSTTTMNTNNHNHIPIHTRNIIQYVNAFQIQHQPHSLQQQQILRRRPWLISPTSSTRSTKTASTQIHGWFTANRNDNTVNIQRQQRRLKQQLQKQKQPKQKQQLLQQHPIVEVGPCIGSGSYGTVHYVYINMISQGDDNDNNDSTRDSDSTNTLRVLIGKRPWTIQELKDQYQLKADNVVNQDEIQLLKDKAIRCQYYYQVEQHCLQKFITTTTTTPSTSTMDDNIDNDNEIASSSSSSSQMSSLLLVPEYVGTGMDTEQREWILVEPLYAPPPLTLMMIQMEPNDNEKEVDDDTTLDIINENNNGESSISTDTVLYENELSSSPPPVFMNKDDVVDDDDDDDDDDVVTEMIAFSLQEIMEVDRINWEQQQQQQQQQQLNGNTPPTTNSNSNGNYNRANHHLYCTSQALLGLDKDHTLVATLDVIMEQLLQILVYIHSYSIVHRDVKPANLLITKPLDDETIITSVATTTTSRLVLIDFGSAGDISTAGLLKENIGLDMNRVAISPIYAAPEIFLDNAGGNKYATNFDCFSVALLYCQLLFQYLDERTESGFHQQMANQNVPWDLDGWLQSAIQSKVRPVGLADALQVLSERPGLWKLLQDMLNPNPTERLSSTDALVRWNKIRSYAIKKSTTLIADDTNDEIDPDLFDGPYLLDVLESLETCEIPTIRPLHFVTSFDRSTSLGLYLAEADGVDITSMDETIQEQWQRATADAGSGEVFVQDIIPGGQADQMGVFAIGDRLQGVGELPLAGGGFERATELIQDQPKSAEFVTLQFDRKSVLVTDIPTDTDMESTTTNDIPMIKKVDQGAWSIKGRRQVQEDAFILHEVMDTKDKSVILAGVFDGHLGSAASDFCRDDLPVAFAAAMNVGTSDEMDNGIANSSENESSTTTFSPSTVQSFLELAWNECCESYRSMCAITDAECIAEYDPKEGILQAKTGSQTAVAGTTAMVFAFDQLSNQLATLNCGDSRGIVLNANNELIFQTTDHCPDVELERLTEMGNPPKCDIARWTIAVNNYDYSVARSLEGNLATSKGIISEADVSLLSAQPGMTILAATDGLWDTIDTAEVMQVVSQLRQIKSSASDIAKALCSLAYEKGSSDNISVVALCLE